MDSEHDVWEKRLHDPNATPMSLLLEFLKAITSDFSKELILGEGGFGVVYKGILRSGKIIAVKKLFEIHLKEETFQNEVRYLMGIKHQNVVRFVGYCAESSWVAMELPGGSGKVIFAEIPKRLLYFEYVYNKSLDNHISDESLGLEWNMRYEIIKGICNGLHFLHDECHIVHLDLKPENILMDSTMNPKITDFGLARIFGEQQSRIVTDNPVGTCGYMAPEYLIRGVVSNKADIFSLGVIVIEIITGHKDYPYFQQDNPHITATSLQQFTEKVLGSWSNKFASTAKCKSTERYTQQVRQCVATALKCVDPSMEKRPTAKDIIQMLNALDQAEAQEELTSVTQCTEKLLVQNTTASKDLAPQSVTEEIFINKEDGEVGEEVTSYDCLSPTPLSELSTGNLNYQEGAKASTEPQSARGTTTESEVITGSILILDVYLLELHFLFEPNKLIPCSLDLTNNTDDTVAFVLKKKRNDHWCFISDLPMCGSVPPRTTYTLVVTMNEHNLPEERMVDLVLLNKKVGSDFSFDVDQIDKMFEKLSHTEYKVTLKAVCALQGETTFEAIPPLIKIISVENRVHDNISSIDTNQIEPLIIVAGFSSGSVYLWNYDMQKIIHLIELHAGKVSSVRFVARKQWFLAGTHDGFVYVFNYERAQKITIFKAHNGYLYSLAVHPTQPYLLLACSSYQLKLWKGWFGWKCVQTFVGHLENVRRVAFNPENTNSFVSASDDHTIKVWNIHSPICNYTLRGHSGGVTSLDFFTRDGHQYLITGSNDRTAKIWDMQKKECVCTLEHHTSAVLSVVSHPNLPLLVTGTYGGLVYLWSSTDFRLIRIVSISGRYSIGGLACLIGSGRVVVAHNEGLSVIEIRDEEQVASKGNSGNSIYARQRQIRKSKAISATD